MPRNPAVDLSCDWYITIAGYGVGPPVKLVQANNKSDRANRPDEEVTHRE